MRLISSRQSILRQGTDTHQIRENGANQLAEFPVASRQNLDSDLQMRQMVTMQNMEEQITASEKRFQKKEKFLDRQSGGGAEGRMDLSGA